MTPESYQIMKQPRDATQPFPWRCNHCGKNAVDMATITYRAEVRHDGRLYAFTIPSLRIPACCECGEKVFTEEVDRQVKEALRLHLEVFTPSRIRDALDRIGLSQKEVAQRLGIAEATLSRWLNETQIQAKSLDRYLRVFFAFPQVREALSNESLDPEFGTQDFVNGNSASSLEQSESVNAARTTS